MPTPHCGAPGGGEGLSVGEVLRRFLPDFLAHSPASPQVSKVLRRLSRCHTGQLGWALWQCERCATPHWRPLGCGDRHCPRCTSRARENWLEKQRQALLPVRYYHWVFTLPAALRPLALQNQKPIYTLLFEAASATLLQFGGERLGARLGVTALLHTWGQNLLEHPHLHCIVTGGGLALEPGPTPVWRGPKQARYLFPVRAVAAMFQGKFLAGLKALRDTGSLEFHGRLELWRDPGVWERTRGVLHGIKEMSQIAGPRRWKAGGSGGQTPCPCAAKPRRARAYARNIWAEIGVQGPWTGKIVQIEPAALPRHGPSVDGYRVVCL